MWPTHGLSAQYWPVVLAGVSAVQIFVFSVSPRDGALTLAPPRQDVAWLHVPTSLFAHADIVHLMSNVVGQCLVGVWVETLHGHATFAILYAATGVGGTLVYRAWWCLQGAPRRVFYMGASPAVYGLVAAHSAHLVLNWSEMPLRVYWFLVCVFVLLVEVVVYAYAPMPYVAYASHLGGAAFGFAWGVLLLHNVRVVQHERIYRVAAAAVVLCGTLGALLCCA